MFGGRLIVHSFHCISVQGDQDQFYEVMGLTKVQPRKSKAQRDLEKGVITQNDYSRDRAGLASQKLKEQKQKKQEQKQKELKNQKQKKVKMQMGLST